ncbi:MAG: PEPxxWA-CTERM sorting domain-containing protein [Proteobacteria bacterium]|nr:PEPxxWA-CTERM sorting domain-containing protein [Pseudomonadota bacterium]
MKPLVIALGILAAIAGVPAQAATITFDEFAPDNDNGAIPAARYAALGVTFVGTDDGSTWGGNANGNPGNWGVDGTNGPVFSGFNGDSNAQTLTFAGTISGFSLDASRTNGSSDGTITLEGYLGATLVASNSVVLGAINSWSALAIAGTFDRIVYSGTGSNFHPFAIDNLNWDARGGVPEPASWALMISGFGLAGVAMRRRAAKAALA